MIWRLCELERLVERMTLDLVLPNEPQGEDRAGEAQERAYREHIVEPPRKRSPAALAAVSRVPGGSVARAWSRLPAEAASTSSRGRSPLAAGVPAASSRTSSAPRPTKIAPQTAMPTATPT
jgi:hypothetical protein